MQHARTTTPKRGGGVESVAIEPTTLTLEVGKDTTLQAKINGVVSTEVEWKSDRSDIATVDNGKVTAKKEGTAKITATAKADQTKTATCTVTVTEKSSTGEIKIELDKTVLSLGEGDSATLQAKINGVVSAEVTWSSDNSDIASVDNNGKVTAMAKGTATITATAKTDTTQTATCAVTVEGANIVQPSGIKVSPLSLSLKVGDTEQVTATIDNENELDADHKKITWTSSKESVATVSDTGLVTAVSVGEATITATTTNGEKATCTVTVTAQASTTVTASDDAWDFVGKVNEAPYKDFDKDSPTAIDSDKSVLGKKGNLKLDFLKSGTKVGDTKGTPGYRYIDDTGLCIKRDALKIDGIKGLVTVTIQWCVKSTTPRNLEVTVNGETKTTSSGNTSGDLPDYTRDFDGGSEGTTLYIGTSEQLFFKSITIKPQSGGTVTPPPTTTDPDPSVDGVITVADTPSGWAGCKKDKDLAGGAVTPPAQYGGYGATASNIFTVSSKADLKKKLSGNTSKIIYIDGWIDMTDGMLPSTAAGTTDKLDQWIKEQVAKLTNTSEYGDVSTSVTSFATWKTWYAGGNTNTADESDVYKKARNQLSNAYSNTVKLTIPSNTTIIGLTAESGIKGGCIKITDVQNVVVRNLIVQDAFDPFPQIEAGDGFNANLDALEISGSKYVWIDHCTLQDTIATTDDDFDHISLSDGTNLKYQVVDGLCDIKKACDFVTVSYCKFANHDKTSLIGHSAKEADAAVDRNHQTITLHHNYYYNCKQRLPMVRLATIHIYNNYYKRESGRQNSYCIGLREENKVYAEGNYFDSSVTATSNSQGDYYFTGNKGCSEMGSAAWTPSDYYTYTLDPVANVDTIVAANAGAGKWTVQK